MDLHGIAAEILGPEEDPRDGEPTGQPPADGIDVGFITATEELMGALKPPFGEDPKASDVARKFLTLFQMAQDLQG